MSEERAKLSALQSAQVTLETELRATKSAELENRRGLMAANDQLEEERRRHVRQIEELDLGIKTMERDLRTQREDIRLLQNDLKMERDTTAALKAGDILLHYYNFNILSRRNWVNKPRCSSPFKHN